MLVEPLMKCVLGVLYKPGVHSDPIELDVALFNILGDWSGERSLMGQGEEGAAIDAQGEHFLLRIILNSQLPLQLVVLQYDREHTWLI